MQRLESEVLSWKPIKIDNIKSKIWFGLIRKWKLEITKLWINWKYIKFTIGYKDFGVAE